MKIIVDTNVLVSGIFFSGPPYIILDAWRRNKVQFIISPDIFDEYTRVSHDLQKQFPAVNIDQFLELILLHSDMCFPAQLSKPVTQDPRDDMFIACALKSGTKIIISGDKHLLNVSGYKNIKVVNPSQFLKEYLG